MEPVRLFAQVASDAGLGLIFSEALDKTPEVKLAEQLDLPILAQTATLHMLNNVLTYKHLRETFASLLQI